jgi:hypothetical protein
VGQTLEILIISVAASTLSLFPYNEHHFVKFSRIASNISEFQMIRISIVAGRKD